MQPKALVVLARAAADGGRLPQNDCNMDESDVLNRLALELLDKRHHISSAEAGSKVGKEAGIYAILAVDAHCVPPPFHEHLIKRNHLCLYVGKTGQGLRRLVHYDLNGQGDSTFFCSLGLVLGYWPPPGSLLGKKHQENFKFSSEDAERIAIWSHQHLAVAWRPLTKSTVDAIEGPLISVVKPLLNLKHNPLKIRELEERRRIARRIASNRPGDDSRH